MAWILNEVRDSYANWGNEIQFLIMIDHDPRNNKDRNGDPNPPHDTKCDSHWSNVLAGPYTDEGIHGNHLKFEKSYENIGMMKVCSQW